MLTSQVLTVTCVVYTKKLGELSEAKDYHYRALAIRLKKLGPEHLDVASSYSHLGSVHKKLGDLGQAKII